MNKENNIIPKWSIKDNVPYCQFEFENWGTDDVYIDLFNLSTGVEKYISVFPIPNAVFDGVDIKVDGTIITLNGTNIIDSELKFASIDQYVDAIRSATSNNNWNYINKDGYFYLYDIRESASDVYDRFYLQTLLGDIDYLNTVPEPVIADTNIKIISSTTSYTEFLYSGLGNQYKIVAIDLQARSLSQMGVPFLWKNYNPSGNSYSKSITPRVSPYQFQLKIDGINAKGLLLNGLNSLGYTIKAGSTIILGLWYAKLGAIKFFDDSINDVNNNGALNQKAVEQSKAYQEHIKEEGSNRIYVEIGEEGLS